MEFDLVESLDLQLAHIILTISVAEPVFKIIIHRSIAG